MEMTDKDLRLEFLRIKLAVFLVLVLAIAIIGILLFSR